MAPHRSNRKGDLGNYRPKSAAADIDNIFLTEEGWVYRHFKGDPRDPNTRFWDEIIVAGEVIPDQVRDSTNPIDEGVPIDNSPCLETINASPRRYLGLGTTPEQNSTDGYKSESLGYDTLTEIDFEQVENPDIRTIGLTDKIFDIEYGNESDVDGGDGGGTTPPPPAGDKILGQVTMTGPKKQGGGNATISDLVPGAKLLFLANTGTYTVEVATIRHTLSCEPSDNVTIDGDPSLYYPNGQYVTFSEEGDYEVTYTSTSTDPEWDQDTQENTIPVTIAIYPPPPGPFEFKLTGMTVEDPYNKNDYQPGETGRFRYLTNLYDSGYEDKITKVEWFDNGNLVSSDKYEDYTYESEYANIPLNESGDHEIKAVVTVDVDGTEQTSEIAETITVIEPYEEVVWEMISFTSEPFTDSIPHGETTNVTVKYRHRSMWDHKFKVDEMISPINFDTGEIAALGEWNFVDTTEVEIADPGGVITEVTYRYTMKNNNDGPDQERAQVYSYVRGVPKKEPPVNRYLETISANLNNAQLGAIYLEPDPAYAYAPGEDVKIINKNPNNVGPGEFCPSQYTTPTNFNTWIGNCSSIRMTDLDGRALTSFTLTSEARLHFAFEDGTEFATLKVTNKGSNNSGAQWFTISGPDGDVGNGGKWPENTNVVITYSGMT